jgi:SAM-dependent methyltransferase
VSVPSADPTALRTGQYADSSNLNARSSIYAYREPDFDLHDWVRSFVPPSGRVLDAGCGPGSYLDHFARAGRGDVFGMDLSPGMAAEAAAFGPVGAADITALPFAADIFDVTMAMHMLYHVDHPSSGVAELRRVTKPGGVMLAVTNGARHLAGFERVIREALGVEHWARSVFRFSLENGEEQIRPHFDEVERTDVEGELVVPHVEPVMAYIASVEDFLAPQLDVVWPEAMDRMRGLVEAEIAETGAFRCTVQSGIFICR